MRLTANQEERIRHKVQLARFVGFDDMDDTSDTAALLDELDALRAKKKTPDEIIQTLAFELRTVINDTSESYLETDPEDAFRDLACRLVIRLARQHLTLVPASNAIQSDNAAAAERIFGSLTSWMAKNPVAIFQTGFATPDNEYFRTGIVTPGKKFYLSVTAAPHTAQSKTSSFYGETLQDAWAQAAQTISFTEGSL